MVLNRTNYGDMLGIEIECYMPKDMFERPSYDEPCDCGDEECDSTVMSNSYPEQMQDILVNRGIAAGIEVTEDGSLDDTDEYIGMEFRVLTSIKDMSNLNALCNYLNKNGVYVNSTCGLHVHLDARDIVNHESIVNIRADRLTNALPFLSQVVSPSRRDNTYCKLHRNYIGRGGRYVAVNVQAFEQHQTIEVRLHQGTTNFKKISEWAKLIFKISRNKNFNSRIPISNEDFYFMQKVSASSQKYFNSRISLFEDHIKRDQTNEESGILEADAS